MNAWKCGRAFAPRCPCVASTSGSGPLAPRSAASGSQLRKKDIQSQRPVTQVAARYRTEAERDSVSTLPVTWDEVDLTDERLSQALQARIERFGSQQPEVAPDEGTAAAFSQSPGSSRSRPLRQATPAALLRRRQRQLSGRRAHALRARRGHSSSSGDSAAVSGQSAVRRQRGRRRSTSRAEPGAADAAVDSADAFKERSSAAQQSGYLDREQEIELIIAIQRASQLRRIRDSAAAEAAAEGRPWTDAEWVQAAGLPSARLLGSALAAGQAAGRRLIDVNKGLLYRLTAQFANQGVSQDELMVDAQQELLRAAERFDASKGARLTTYAWHNIMNRLTLVVNREGGLLPVSKVGLEAIRKMDEAEALLQQRLGRAPTLAEIAAQVGVSPKRAAVLRARRGAVVAWDAMSNPADRDDKRGGDDIIGDADVADASAPDFYEEEQRRSLQNVIGLALEVLEDERMREVLKLRYGLDDGVPRTLADIGAKLKTPMSIEGVRQLAEKGRVQMEAFIREHNLLQDLLPENSSQRHTGTRWRAR